MSIDRVNISNQGIDRSQGAKPNEPTSSAGKDRQVPAGTDAVVLSSKANELNRVANSVEESRAARFNKVRAQLESGSYQVSTRDLVQALIDSNMK